jgi:hypothetical protein
MADVPTLCILYKENKLNFGNILDTLKKLKDIVGMAVL